MDTVEIRKPQQIIRRALLPTEIVVALSVAVLSLMTSCGTSQKTVSGEVNPYGKSVASEPCIELYEQNPSVRAYGQGQHFKEMTARNIAELQANAMFARKIEQAVISATEDLGISLSQYAADDKSGRSVTDQSAESKDLAASISQQVVRDAHVIKTSRYIGKNNQFTVFVCMEYGTDKDALVKDIEDKVKEKISADDRATLEKRHNEFRDKVYGKLKNQ